MTVVDGPAPQRLACVVASPRTGSTQLGRVLSSFPQVVSYGEIFHPHAAYSLRPLLGEISERGVSLPDDERDKRTIDFVRSNPGIVLDVMVDRAGPDKLVTFKVFSFHLTKSQMVGEVLARPDVAPVFLRRRVIDSYISSLKAAEMSTWRDEDTTNLRVSADIKEFQKWAKRELAWYQWTSAEAINHGSPLRVLTYEEDIEPGEERTAARLGALFESLGLAVDHTPGAVDSMKKQDRSRALSEKMTNWPEFERKLRSRDLHELALGYFL